MGSPATISRAANSPYPAFGIVESLTVVEALCCSASITSSSTNATVGISVTIIFQKESIIVSMNYLICSKNCVDKIDFHCSACQSRWHYICVPYNSCYRCIQCDIILSDTTVGFWCISARDNTVDREGSIYDLNYLKDGKIVAFRPYRWIAGVFHPIGQPAISAEIYRNPHLIDWCKDNWDKIEGLLKNI
jgi:hypothetical protein